MEENIKMRVRTCARFKHVSTKGGLKFKYLTLQIVKLKRILCIRTITFLVGNFLIRYYRNNYYVSNNNATS